MSSASATLKMILLGDSSGAVKAMRDVGKESETSSKKMQAFHKVGNAAGIALAGGLALAATAAVSFTKNAAQDQQSAALLARTLHANAGATKAQTAAVEAWITAQGKAKGFSDEELRPALSRLSVATGSVAKSQKLAGLAMDISTGTGKSLKTVAEALAKAQNGNVASLARLGVRTTTTAKDTVALQKAQTGVKSATLAYASALKTYGKGSMQASIAADKLKQAHEAVGAAQEKTKRTTLSLSQITKNLTDQYGGAAAKNATTAAGKQKILTVQIEELKEQIGMGLLPVMTKLTAVGIGVVNWISKNTTTAGILIAAIGALVAVTWAVSAAIAAWEAITKIATATQIVFTNAQWALNIAMEANPIGLIVLAIVAFVAVLVLAYKHSATFRAIVQGAFHAVQAAASFAFNWIKGHWKLILAILGGPIVAAVIIITSNWGKIKAGASAVWSYIKTQFGKLLAVLVAPFKAGVAVISAVWGQMRGMVVAYVKFMSSLPGKILSAIGNVGSLLFNAGKAVIQGLINGIESMIGALTSKLHAITAMFPHIKGPIEKDRVLLRPAGVAIMEGLISGIASQETALTTILNRITDAVKTAGDKLHSALSARNSFASGFSSFATSLFGNATGGTDADGNALAPTTASILAYQQHQAHMAHRVNVDVKSLIKKGLSKSLIKQLQASGASGMAQLQALQSATPAQIAALNRANAQTGSNLHAAGMSAGNAIYGKQIQQDRHHYNEEKRLLQEIRDAVKNPKDLVARIKGGDLEIALAHHKRVGKGNQKLAFQ